MVANGVTFRTIYTGTPKFHIGNWYLLFLKKLPSDQQFKPAYYGTELYYSFVGPRGAFEISYDHSTLTGLDVPGSHQRTQLLLRFLNHVEPFFQFLRDEIRRQGERKPERARPF